MKYLFLKVTHSKVFFKTFNVDKVKKKRISHTNLFVCI